MFWSAFPSLRTHCDLLESSSSATPATLTQNTHHIFFGPWTNIKGGQQLCERYELKRKPTDSFSPLHPKFTLVADFNSFLFPCKRQDFRLWFSYIWNPWFTLTTGWLQQHSGSTKSIPLLYVDKIISRSPRETSWEAKEISLVVRDSLAASPLRSYTMGRLLLWYHPVFAMKITPWLQPSPEWRVFSAEGRKIVTEQQWKQNLESGHRG